MTKTPGIFAHPLHCYHTTPPHLPDLPIDELYIFLKRNGLNNRNRWIRYPKLNIIKWLGNNGMFLKDIEWLWADQSRSPTRTAPSTSYIPTLHEIFLKVTQPYSHAAIITKNQGNICEMPWTKSTVDQEIKDKHYPFISNSPIRKLLLPFIIHNVLIPFETIRHQYGCISQIESNISAKKSVW